MKGRVSPLGQVESRQDTALTGNTWVDFMIGQDHCIDLNGVDVVAVVAEDARHLDLADFTQLFKRETARPAPVFVPETIARTEVAKLLANNAGKSRAHHRSGQGLLGDAGRPQVDVFGRLVILFVALHGGVVHDAVQIVEMVDPLKATEFTPSVV